MNNSVMTMKFKGLKWFCALGACKYHFAKQYWHKKCDTCNLLMQ